MYGSATLLQTRMNKQRVGVCILGHLYNAVCAPSTVFQRDDVCWELCLPTVLTVQPPRRHNSLGWSQSAPPHEPMSRTKSAQTLHVLTVDKRPQRPHELLSLCPYTLHRRQGHGDCGRLVHASRRATRLIRAWR